MTSGGKTAGVGTGVAAITGTVGTVGREGADRGGVVPHPVTISATKIDAPNDEVMRETVAMIESGMWIFLVEAAAAGCLFVGLIWWVVKGTGARDQKLKEFDEKARKTAETDSAKTNTTDNP